MRKVTQLTAEAFREGETLAMGNTLTADRRYYLHGHCIAARQELHKGILHLSMCGWPTVTTRERLNGIMQEMGVNGRVYQRDYNQYLHLSGDTYLIPDPNKLFTLKRLSHGEWVPIGGQPLEQINENQ